MSIVIGGTEIRVLSKPNLSIDGIEEVRVNLETSMWADCREQYCVASIVELIASGKLKLPTADAVVLGAIMREGYDYIEI